MGAVVSCIKSVFRAIGSVLRAVVNGVTGILMAIIYGVANVFNIIISCLTCGRAGSRRQSMRTSMHRTGRRRVV